MADSSELFIFGDDFDAILDILEEEEELDEYFTEAADDASIIAFLISLKSERKQQRSTKTKMVQIRPKSQGKQSSSPSRFIVKSSTKQKPK